MLNNFVKCIYIHMYFHLNYKQKDVTSAPILSVKSYRTCSKLTLSSRHFLSSKLYFELIIK